MVIPSDTRMMLFRYSNYRKYSFIDEHIKVLQDNDYVWLMKVGKRTNLEKINDVLDNGGFLILKSPLKEGGKYYICCFTDIRENEIDDPNHVPSYYDELMEDIDFYDRRYQLFKVTWILPLPDSCSECLVLQLNGKQVSDIIKRTRTAVMFVQNEKTIDLPERM